MRAADHERVEAARASVDLTRERATRRDDEGVLVVRRPGQILEPAERETRDLAGVLTGEGPRRVNRRPGERVARARRGDRRDVRERDAWQARCRHGSGGAR